MVPLPHLVRCLLSGTEVLVGIVDQAVLSDAGFPGRQTGSSNQVREGGGSVDDSEGCWLCGTGRRTTGSKRRWVLVRSRRKVERKGGDVIEKEEEKAKRTLVFPQGSSYDRLVLGRVERAS